MYKKAFPALKASIYISALLFLLSCGEKNDPLIQKANQEWIQGHNHSALELLNEVLKKNPTGQKAEKALFRMGEIHHFSLNNSIRALVFFQEVRQMNREGPFGYKAQKYIAEIAEFSLKDYDQAIVEYQTLINFHKDEFSKGENQFRIASIYYKKQNYHQALVELQILLENYPKSPWAEETKFKIVEILYTLNRCPEAREQYRRFNLEYRNSRFKSEMDFVVASCLEEEGHLQDAYNLFKALEGQYTYPSILKMKLLGIEKRIEKIR
ncbi:MAG: tetratricopeptide repeat protein [Nitrospinota bacterium]|nr:tetratricopeptide repeat protein [Nitrospinota bacterium]